MTPITKQQVKDQRERCNSADASYTVRKEAADAAAHSAANQRLAFSSLMEKLADEYIPIHSEGAVVVDDVAVVQVFIDTSDGQHKTVKVLPAFHLDEEV